MKHIKTLSISLMLIMGLSFVACGGDDDDDDEDKVENNNNAGSSSDGGSSTSYTFKQMTGYWVNIEQWNLCRQTIKYLPASGTSYSSVYLENLAEGVDGYYIDSDGFAYEIFLTATTTKYNNNPTAGNQVLKSWTCLDNKTVYFMNTIGGKYRHNCSVEENQLIIGTSYYPIISTSSFIGNNQQRFEKVILSL